YVVVVTAEVVQGHGIHGKRNPTIRPPYVTLVADNCVLEMRIKLGGPQFCGFVDEVTKGFRIERKPLIDVRWTVQCRRSKKNRSAIHFSGEEMPLFADLRCHREGFVVDQPRG